MTTSRMSAKTEGVLRSVIYGDPYHMQFSPLVHELDHVRAERDRANRILAALRAPSKEVWGAALEAYNNAPFATHTPRLIRALLAAVTASEQEVGRE